MKEIDVRELANWLSDANLPKPVLLDVREAGEVAICQIPGSVHIPMHSVPTRLEELKQGATIVCICHHGGRSGMVARFLMGNGFSDVINLVGGIHAWANQVDPNMETY